MMDYTELIIDILINLFLTVIFYESVPLILKYIIEKHYSEKEAKKIAIINTVCVYTLISILYLLFLDEAKLANPAAAFIWGTVAFNILKSNKKISPKEYKQEINNENIDSLKRQNILENNIHGKHSKQTSISLRRGWKAAVAILSMTTIVVTILFINSINDIELLDEKIVDLNSTILTLKSLNNNLEERNENLQEAKEKANFLDEYIVIRPVNTKVYHKYGCEYCEDGSFYIYDINEAIANGYAPCNNCINSSSKSSWEKFKELEEKYGL